MPRRRLLLLLIGAALLAAPAGAQDAASGSIVGVTEMVFDDPGTFSRPVIIKYESTLRPATDEVMEYVCQENNQYGFAGGAR